MANDSHTRWLGLSADDAHRNYYRLLRLRNFERDPATVALAVEELKAPLRIHLVGSHADEVQDVLTTLDSAVICLSDPFARDAHDADLMLRGEHHESFADMPRGPLRLDAYQQPRERFSLDPVRGFDNGPEGDSDTILDATSQTWVDARELLEELTADASSNTPDRGLAVPAATGIANPPSPAAADGGRRGAVAEPVRPTSPSAGRRGARSGPRYVPLDGPFEPTELIDPDAFAEAVELFTKPVRPTATTAQATAAATAAANDAYVKAEPASARPVTETPPTSENGRSRAARASAMRSDAAADVRHAASEQTVTAEPTRTGTRSNRIVWSLVATGCALLVAVTAWFWRPRGVAENAADAVAAGRSLGSNSADPREAHHSRLASATGSQTMASREPAVRPTDGAHDPAPAVGAAVDRPGESASAAARVNESAPRAVPTGVPAASQASDNPPEVAASGTSKSPAVRLAEGLSLPAAAGPSASPSAGSASPGAPVLAVTTPGSNGEGSRVFTNVPASPLAETSSLHRLPLDDVSPKLQALSLPLRKEYFAHFKGMLEEGWSLKANALETAQTRRRLALVICDDDPRLPYGWALVLLRHNRRSEALDELKAAGLLGRERFPSAVLARVCLLLQTRDKGWTSLLAELETLLRTPAHEAGSATHVETRAEACRTTGRIIGYLLGPAELSEGIDLVRILDATLRRDLPEADRLDYVAGFDQIAIEAKHREGLAKSDEDREFIARKTAELSKKKDENQLLLVRLAKSIREAEEEHNSRLEKLDKQRESLRADLEKTSTSVAKLGQETQQLLQNATAAKRRAVVNFTVLEEETPESRRLLVLADERRLQWNEAARQLKLLQTELNEAVPLRLRQETARFEKESQNLGKQELRAKRLDKDYDDQLKRVTLRAPTSDRAKSDAKLLRSYVVFDIDLERERLLSLLGDR